MSKVRDVSAFAHNWCHQRQLGTALSEDVVQEAWVAALESDYDQGAIVRAMNRYRMQEYHQPMSFTDVGEDFDADDLGENGCRKDDLGLHFDSYHGWCRDDV